MGSTFESAASVAELVLSEFDEFYLEFQQLTADAKSAFEKREYQISLRISEQKLTLYSTSMYSLSERLSNSFPAALRESSLWLSRFDSGPGHHTMHTQLRMNTCTSGISTKRAPAG